MLSLSLYGKREALRNKTEHLSLVKYSVNATRITSKKQEKILTLRGMSILRSGRSQNQ